MNLVFDLDGVVYVGNQAIPGARQVLEWATGAGHRVLFVTNNSVRTPQQVIDKIRQVVGFEPDLDQVITSAMAAAALVSDRSSRRCFVVGEAGITEALTERGIGVTTEPSEADHAVVGLTRSLTYDLLAGATTAVRGGATLVATNLDPTFPTPAGLRPGAGSIVAAVETSTGVVAIPAGKPFLPMLRLVEARAEPGPVMVIGDRPDTDLALGKARGWATALCLTGVTDQAEDVPDELAPDVVIDSVADLPAVVDQRRGEVS